MEEAQRRYLNYAVSVITARALPDVRDGLKPVQRRILYAMYHNLHLYPDQRFRKCAAIVGDVLGKYHPHGDTAAYDALVRMAQDFSLRYPLIEGHGNFGSLDGDAPAAMRYTEARLQKLAMQLLDEIDEGTVDFRPNYDGSQEEPIVLPAKLPQLLANGCAGIAVGMATNIPPHNLSELCEAAVALIDDRSLEVKDLLKFIKGPDFPTAARGHQLQEGAARHLRDRARLDPHPGRVEDRGAQAGRAAARHHLHPLQRHQVDPGREDRRGDPGQEVADADRRARRVHRRGAGRARAQGGGRSQPGDGLPVQAHPARAELPGQHDLPGAHREPRGGGPHAAEPQVDPRRVPQLPAGGGHPPLPVRAGPAEEAHPHPGGLPDHLRRPRRDHPHHPQVARARPTPPTRSSSGSSSTPSRPRPSSSSSSTSWPGWRSTSSSRSSRTSGPGPRRSRASSRTSASSGR